MMRIKRTIDIAMSNYEDIIGACVFTYEGRLVYSTEKMRIQDDIPTILQAWQNSIPNFNIQDVNFITALADKNKLIAINPEGAVSLIVGTGKGVWFVAVFIPMDVDKEPISNECVQAAKNLETSVSIFDV